LHFALTSESVRYEDVSTLELKDPYQTEEYAAYKESFGYHVERVKDTNIFKRLGGVEIEFPNNPLHEIFHNPANARVHILNDIQYSGGLVNNWKGERRDGTSAKVDLSPDDLWVRLKKQHRNAVRQAEAKGCAIRIGEGHGDFEKFYGMHKRLSEIKHFTPMQHDNMLELSKTSIVSIYFAMVQDREAATAFILKSPSVWRFGWGAGLPEFYAYRPSNLLHWKIIRDAKKVGALWYDLGGAGKTNIFKMGFGAVRVPFQYLDYPKNRKRIFMRNRYVAWGLRHAWKLYTSLKQ
jgi:hypothetical protein